MTESDELRTRRERTAGLLGVRVEELDYITELPSAAEQNESDALPPGEDADDEEVSASRARGLVVPNRISYGVYLQQVGFTGNDTRWAFLGPDCSRTSWYYLWGSQINRWERAGYCRRPQTDSYDIRWKIYWRA